MNVLFRHGTSFPDPLTLPSGGQASTGDEWHSFCRPMLAERALLFEYGAIPRAPSEMAVSIVHENPLEFDGLATSRVIEIATKSPDSTFDLLLVTPNQTVPSPCFLGLNFRGNHSVLRSPLIRPPMLKRGSSIDTESERGSEVEAWSAETIIRRGYGLSTIYNGDVVPDSADGAKERLAYFEQFSRHVDDGDIPAALGCWAWSLSRAVDFLVQSDFVDSQRIAAVGHSRNGKAALLAAAFDTRIALVIASQSGTGGAGPSRDIGEPLSERESVEGINTGFPHWFCGNFKNYNLSADGLPFDQHSVIALCAPRPVLLSAAEDDLWANPIGSFHMLLAADPVYRLMCGEGLDIQVMPEPGILVNSRLGHFLRKGGHSMTGEDWNAWLGYADKYFKRLPK